MHTLKWGRTFGIICNYWTKPQFEEVNLRHLPSPSFDRIFLTKILVGNKKGCDIEHVSKNVPSVVYDTTFPAFSVLWKGFGKISVYVSLIL